MDCDFVLPLLSISTHLSPPNASLGSFALQFVKSTGVPSIHLKVHKKTEAHLGRRVFVKTEASQITLYKTMAPNQYPIRNR